MIHGISPLGIVLLVLLIVLLIGGLPRWGYAHQWGYYPSSLIGVLLIVLIILLVLGFI